MTEEAVQARLKQARVARLATGDEQGRPHMVPICYVYDGQRFYTALDQKPKQVSPERLARMRHIQANPNVALLVDEYGEDWGKLWYILVRGKAEILSKGEKHDKALCLLKEKYPQYASGTLLPQQALVIQIVPTQIINWGRV